MRRRRRKLGIGAQIASARHLAGVISCDPIYSISRHIAFYLPNDGEISLWPLLRHAWSHGKQCYLPVIDGDQLQFRCFTPGGRLVSNRFGILEPAFSRERPLIDLDLVLTPLVAFDRWGNRLGMGGGFYDRTFASQLMVNGQLRKKRPILCGIGHRLQQVEKLTPQDWDFPLDYVAVDNAILRCRVR